MTLPPNEFAQQLYVMDAVSGAYVPVDGARDYADGYIDGLTAAYSRLISLEAATIDERVTQEYFSGLDDAAKAIHALIDAQTMRKSDA